MGVRRAPAPRIPASALVAALEHVPRPAFVVTPKGTVLLANRLGAAWITGDRTRREALAELDPIQFETTRFSAEGREHRLAVLRRAPERAEGRVTVPPAWGLTRREREVLDVILRGGSNPDIAAALGCARKTVEHHVSAILKKAGVESRAALMVVLLRG
jgi:DNA-binding NarL/FixJ family response regulator